MAKTGNIYKISFTLLFAVAVCAFFGIRYPYHMHFQEQYQLFQFTLRYFAETVLVPGGLADYLGRFLTQFFYYAWAGAFIIAALLAAVQLACWYSLARRNLLTYALSFLPSVLLCSFLCDENALLSAPVAVLLSLLAAVAVTRCSCMSRNAIALVLVPVLYLACGSLSAVYVLAWVISLVASKPGRREVLLAIAAVVLFLACPLISIYLFPYSFRRLMMGIHYYRYPYVLPTAAWLSVAGAAVAMAVSALRLRDGSYKLAGTACFAAVAVLGGFIVSKSADMEKEEIMKYDFMVRMNMWNRIMMTADQKNPSLPYTVSCLNLALAKTGRMADHMFDYYQNGPAGLLPDFVRDCTTPLPTAEAFWQLGMVNTSQRYTFEAQEAIPDFQKSARCYQQLAETNIVNHDYGVARKYLDVLSHTLYYSGWARERLALLGDDAAVATHPEYGAVQQLRLKDHDFLFSDTEMDSMLGLLFVENKANTMAFDYLMAWTLLRKDLPRFVECLHLSPYAITPKAWQEAMALYLVLSQVNPDSFPAFISDNVRNQVNAFITAMNSGKSEGYMQSKYGNTYWFYYYYRYR